MRSVTSEQLNRIPHTTTEQGNRLPDLRLFIHSMVWAVEEPKNAFSSPRKMFAWAISASPVPEPMEDRLSSAIAELALFLMHWQSEGYDSSQWFDALLAGKIGGKSLNARRHETTLHKNRGMNFKLSVSRKLTISIRFKTSSTLPEHHSRHATTVISRFRRPIHKACVWVCPVGNGTWLSCCGRVPTG